MIRTREANALTPRQTEWLNLMFKKIVEDINQGYARSNFVVNGQELADIIVALKATYINYSTHDSPFVGFETLTLDAMDFWTRDIKVIRNDKFRYYFLGQDAIVQSSTIDKYLDGTINNSMQLVLDNMPRHISDRVVVNVDTEDEELFAFEPEDIK